MVNSVRFINRDLVAWKFEEMRQSHTMDELAKWLAINASKFYVDKSMLRWDTTIGPRVNHFCADYVEINRLEYDAKIKSYHSSPLGKPRYNHQGLFTQPLMYAGWSGDLNVRSLSKNTYSILDLLRGSGLNTGTGGGGNSDYACHITLYTEDWPNLARTAKIIYNKLSDLPPEPLVSGLATSHTFKF